MANPNLRGNPIITVVILVIVALAAAFTFSVLHRGTTSPQAAGAAGLGHDAVVAPR